MFRLCGGFAYAALLAPIPMRVLEAAAGSLEALVTVDAEAKLPARGLDAALVLLLLLLGTAP